eukprot:jgi/Astpho2/8268/Aster-01351
MTGELIQRKPTVVTATYSPVMEFPDRSTRCSPGNCTSWAVGAGQPADAPAQTEGKSVFELAVARMAPEFLGGMIILQRRRLSSSAQMLRGLLKMPIQRIGPTDSPEQWLTELCSSNASSKAIAERFATEGATIHLAARTKSQMEEVAESCKAKGAADVLVHAIDLTDVSAINQLAKTLQEHHQACDVLVNNAGIMPQREGPTNDASAYEDWHRTMQVNVLAPMQLTSLLVPAMQKQKWGLIVNIGSVAGVEPMAGTPAYATSKHALKGWSTSCYAALRNDNIKVVLINPAAVRTGGCLPSVRVSSCWVCALIADTNNGASLCADMTAGRGFIPERMLHPEDIAESAMLALHTSENACPQEITMRLGQSAMQ